MDIWETIKQMKRDREAEERMDFVGQQYARELQKAADRAEAERKAEWRTKQLEAEREAEERIRWEMKRAHQYYVGGLVIQMQRRGIIQ